MELCYPIFTSSRKQELTTQGVSSRCSGLVKTMRVVPCFSPCIEEFFPCVVGIPKTEGLVSSNSPGFVLGNAGVSGFFGGILCQRSKFIGGQCSGTKFNHQHV